MLWMVTPTQNHTLPSRGYRALLYCCTVPRMRQCECLHLSFSAVVFAFPCHMLADFSCESVSSPWQIYPGGSSVIGSNRSWLHLDCVKSHDWKSRLYPWGSEAHDVVNRWPLSGRLTKSIFNSKLFRLFATCPKFLFCLPCSTLINDRGDTLNKQRLFFVCFLNSIIIFTIHWALCLCLT